MVIRPVRSSTSGSAHLSPIWRALLVVIALAAGSCQASTQVQAEPVVSSITSPTLTTLVITTEPATPVGTEVLVKVVSVTDGDTIRVLMPDGTNEPVRLIGIDSPEDGSLLAQEATDYMEELVLGKDVRMVIDVRDRDRFDRLLRYIYVGDLFVNEEMVRVGLAISKRYEPDTSMAHVLEAAQGGAESAALGLFSPDAMTTIATTTTAPPTTTTQPPTTTTRLPTTTTTIGATTTTTAQANCSPYYPDFCIPPPPPDLNCGDIGARDFTVLPPDPHGFDRDGDGVGCES